MTLIESLPNDSVLIDGTMPGSRPMKPMKLPLTLGSCVSVSLVMLPPISFDVTSTSGDSAETLTVSSTQPTSICSSMLGGLADFEQQIPAFEFLEALQLAGDLVGAGHDAAGDEGAIAPLTVSRNMPVSWLRTVTVTPGNTPPCASITRPRTSVVPCCASSGAAKSRTMQGSSKPSYHCASSQTA